jgi:hypothetical protein
MALTMKLLAIDLEVDLHIRVLEAHAVAHAVLVQTAAHVAFNLQRGEFVLAVALGTHAEGLALELITPDGFHLLEDVVQVGKLAGLHLEEGLNAGDAGQGFDGLLAELVIAELTISLSQSIRTRASSSKRRRTLRILPCRILMKRWRTDLLLMVISGNSLIMNFMVMTRVALI